MATAAAREATFAARFWSRVDKRGPDECWTWKGHTSGGYGVVRWRGNKDCRAHRIAWMLTSGEIPAGLCVCHRCDNPPCCNPAHFFLGTPAENTADRDAKGRTLRGLPAALRKSKLKAPDIAAIRAAHLTTPDEYRVWGARLGVSDRVIYRVATGRSWCYPGLPKVEAL